MRTDRRLFPGLLQLLVFAWPTWTPCAVVTTLSTTATLTAQVEWTRAPVLDTRGYPGVAFDAARGKAVLFGGHDSEYGSIDGETWEWDGVEWKPRGVWAAMFGRHASTLCYDSVRARVLLYGGASTTYYPQVMEWDGTQWLTRNAAAPPPVRYSHGAAFDSQRGRMVVFGGYSSLSVSLADTWEWDGTAWLQATPAHAPSARVGCCMAYDPVRKRTVMFGGGTSSDTWEWDGNDWLSIPTTVQPSARGDAAMIFDPGRNACLLFGGKSTARVESDVWSWSGTSWSQLSLGSGPGARYAHGMFWDSARGQVVVTCGVGAANNGLNDTWALNGSTWRLLAGSASPRPRIRSAAVFDGNRQRIVMFSGEDSLGRFNLDDFWEWNGTSWNSISGVRPSARYDHSLAYDRGRGRVVLFGGGATNDTWEWDGNVWKQLTPASSPSNRAQCAMWYDEVRGRILLYGGVQGFIPLDDMWQWDGTSWTQIAGSTAITPKRGDSGIAYDRARRRAVLFGGFLVATQTSFTDLWEWDGYAWSTRSAGTPVMANASTQLGYDEARGRVVRFGFNVQDTATHYVTPGTYEWDGATWSLRTSTLSPQNRNRHVIAYDEARHVMLVTGGYPYAGQRLMDTWEYGPVFAAASASFGQGCAGNNGTPALEFMRLPWIGDTLTARLMALGANPFLNAPFLMLGDSRTTWGPLGLPLDLSFIGMTGCTAYTNSIANYALANVGGTATWSAQIPNITTLAGTSLYTQAGVTAPGANPFGVALSNACELKIGAK